MHMSSPVTSSSTLIVDSRGPSGAHRARSRGEALERITANVYDSIVLHTEMAGRDEYDLISYLAATWPVFLRQLAIHTMTASGSSCQWNHETASLDALPSPQRRYSFPLVSVLPQPERRAAPPAF
jgi:CheY-like chemotaxis protein